MDVAKRRTRWKGEEASVRIGRSERGSDGGPLKEMEGESAMHAVRTRRRIRDNEMGGKGGVMSASIRYGQAGHSRTVR
jgi:hypothetical protein